MSTELKIIKFSNSKNQILKRKNPKFYNSKIFKSKEFPTINPNISKMQ